MIDIMKGSFLRTTDPQEVRYNCPECGDTKHHLYLNVKKKAFYCQKCGYKGFFKRPYFEDIPDLKYWPDILENFVDGSIEKKKVMGQLELESIKLPEEYIAIQPEKEGRMNEICLSYLKKRDVTPEETERYKLGYCIDGRYRGRIIIPCYNKKGLLTFFTARLFRNDSFYSRSRVFVRYLNPLGFSKAGAIFKTFIGKVETAVIVEGPFGAMRVGKVMPAIATMGKMITGEQRLRIKDSCEKAVIMFDPDAKGKAIETKIGMDYYLPTSIIFLEKFSPDEISKKGIERLLWKRKIKREY